MTARTILAAVVIITVGLGDGAQADVLRGDYWKSWPSGNDADRLVQWHTSAPNQAGEKVVKGHRARSTSTSSTSSSKTTARPASASSSNRPTGPTIYVQPISAGYSSSNVLSEGNRAFGETSTTKTDRQSNQTTSARSSETPSKVDAYINLGSGEYPSAERLAEGDPQPWYTSPVVKQFYGDQEPDAAARAQFTENVLSRVEETYLQSGLEISLTTDPDLPSAHTLSVVADSSYPGNSKAIGVADLKGNGFTFIDEFTPAKSLDSLTWAIAKNVAHELMHAVGGHHFDESGEYLDAGVLSWDVLLDPEVTVFSPESVSELASLDFQDRSEFNVLGLQGVAGHEQYCQCGHPGHGQGTIHMQQTVPEPTTVALWALGAAGLIIVGRRRQQARR